MLFNQPVFLFGLLPVAWIGFRAICPFNYRLSLIWLVAISLFFYGWGNPRFLILLVTSMIGNYLVGELIRTAKPRPALQSAILSVAVAADIANLAYFKYLSAIIGFFGSHGILSFSIGSITLPLGISFFTFTQIAYLLDVSSGEAEDRDPVSYAVFVTFFPHLIAGPILHHAEMMPQFRQRGVLRFNPPDLMVGIVIFTIGLAKKDLIADPTSLVVGPAFAHAADLGLFESWRAALSYSLQLYFDFSGYSDMAIGLGRMFGIRFPLNFNSPYKAASIIDYWQRWHMTLTRYLTRYLFNPLALATMHALAARRRRQRRKLSRIDRFSVLVIVPLPITMAIAGIWHGAGLQFLVFGLLHGAYLMVNHLWRHFRGADAVSGGYVQYAANVLLTYLCVLVGSVFFRSSDVTGAMHMLAGMIGIHGVERIPSFGMGWIEWEPVIRPVAWLSALYSFVLVLPNTQQIMGRFQPALGYSEATSKATIRYRFTPGWAIAVGVVGAVAVLLRQQAEFIYFQF